MSNKIDSKTLPDPLRRRLLAAGLASAAAVPLTAMASPHRHGGHAGHGGSQGHQHGHGGHAGHGAHGAEAPPYTADELKQAMGYDRLEDIPVRGPATAVDRLPFTERDGVKEFELTAEAVLWEYADGQTVMAWGYNGQLPGPEIRVTEGDRVRIRFTNKLPQPTSLHWHGLHVPFAMDGVPGLTQEPIQPGQSFVYEFEAKPAGTRFYHSHGSHHGDESVQIDMGLAGAFIVEPREGERSYDREMTLVISEHQLGEGSANLSALGDHGAHHAGGEHSSNYNLFTLNGRIYPDVKPFKVREGERVRMRLINAGSMSIHPMHLHGHTFEIVAIDGNDVPDVARQRRDVVTLASGERFDIEFVCDNPGVWLFHCHELHHAAMGMIMLVEYEGFEVGASAQPATSTGGHRGHRGHH